MSSPTQTCSVCGDYEIVRPDGRGFPPDIAKRRLQKRCLAAGHKCVPTYGAGILLAAASTEARVEPLGAEGPRRALVPPRSESAVGLEAAGATEQGARSVRLPDTSFTKVGEGRYVYAQLVEQPPSRFANEGRDYGEWAERADAWALKEGLGD